ncbi:MAG TPA: helix-turn-helix transcriptional regulator [Clostridiales bacterium]|nr:helix-turn-helix transcriptional regulator [Clostridiales bacterium]
MQESRIYPKELGKAVGVSTQAVSLWECGGTPDIELLPAIANKLSVSIDTLFGRENTTIPDICDLLYQSLRQLPEDQRMEKACEYVWVLQRAALSNTIPAEKTVGEMLTAISDGDRASHLNPYRPLGTSPWETTTAPCNTVSQRICVTL